jgi:phage tail-like protein
MALRSADKDPLRNFIFMVEIDGAFQGGFSEATGYDQTSDVIEYREGDEVTTPRKLAGLSKWGDIVLKWGLSDSTYLWDWRKEIVDGKDSAKPVSIVVYDGEGNEKIRWNFTKAWPSKLDAADMNAKGNDVAIMQMTLSHEGMTKG